VAAAAFVPSVSPANAYTVPDLPYPFEALEPYIDTPTMKIHHDKHHGTSVPPPCVSSNLPFSFLT
jgi:Fe-Mn family superoxide dismutase